MKRLIIWIVFFVVVFVASYLLVDVFVKAAMADYKEPTREAYHGLQITVGARVEWMKVESHTYTTNEPLQPAFNIATL